MNSRFRNFIPVGVGIAGAILLTGVYFGLVAWAESPRHAAELFWEDRWLVIPILLGFGVQAALYSILKLRLYMPYTAVQLKLDRASSASRAALGTGGTASTIAMAACCAHHVTDVLPILGLTVAATFLAEYQKTFMAAGLAANLIGIVVILVILIRASRAAINSLDQAMLTSEEI